MLRAIPPPSANLPTPPPAPKRTPPPPSGKREKELEYELRRKDRLIETLSEQNSQLQRELAQLKQAKQGSDERVIQLSNQLYQAERQGLMMATPPCSSLNQTFDLVAAVTEQKEGSGAVRSSLDSLVGVLLNQECDPNWQENSEPNHEAEAEGKSWRDNPMRLSMPVVGERAHHDERHSHAMRQMQLMKRKTERMMEIEEGRRTLRPSLAAPACPVPEGERPRRRFQRLR